MGDPNARLIELAEKLSVHTKDFVYLKKMVLTTMIHRVDEDEEKNTIAFNALIGNIGNMSDPNILTKTEKTLVYDFLQRVFCDWLVPDASGNVDIPNASINVAEVVLRTPAWKVNLTHGESDADTVSDVGLAFALINATRSAENNIDVFMRSLSFDVVMSLMLFFKIMLVFIYKSTNNVARQATITYFSATSRQLMTVVTKMKNREISFSPFISTIISFLGRYMPIVVKTANIPKAQVAFILDSIDDIMLGNYEDCFDIRNAVTENVHIFSNSFAKINDQS